MMKNFAASKPASTDTTHLPKLIYLPIVLLLLILFAIGMRLGQGIEYFNEPLRGHLDIQASDFRSDGVTQLKGWAYHATGVRTVTLIIDEVRRLPMRIGLERPDVATVFPGRPGIELSGLLGEYEFGSAVHGSHTFELEVTLGDGRTMQLGPWRVDLGGRPWRLPAGYTDRSAEPFHLSIANSYISLETIDEIQQKFSHYQTESMRVAITAPILYLRTTLGRAGDWEFDPSFDTNRKCGERRLAEDNLNTTIGHALQKHQPTLFTLNGGVWADAACDMPDWDINDELEKDKTHVQWNERNQVVADDYLSHLPGSIHAPELGRILSYNVYNKTARAYKKRNLQSAARLVADLNHQHPELVVGINLDADTYINPFFEGQQWYDYNPDTIRQFREWLQGIGPYASGWSSPDVPNLSNYRRRKNYSLEEVNTLAGVHFAQWEDVDPPRQMSTPKMFFENPWFAVWDEFRRHLVDLHYDELSQWVYQAGVPKEKIYSSQGFQAPGELINPFAIYIDSPPKNYDTGGMSVEGAVPSHGRLGAILYAQSARNDIRTENKQPLFSIFNELSPGWGVVEFHPADLKHPRRVPTFAESYEALDRMLTGGAQFVSVMAWNGGSGQFRNDPGYVAFTVIKDTPLESAMTALMSNYGGLPRGSVVWAFGGLGLTSEDGWKTTEGIGNSAFGRYHLRMNTAGLATMELVATHVDQAPKSASALAMEVRSEDQTTLSLNSGSGAPSTVTVQRSDQPQTVLLPINSDTIKMDQLRLEVTGPANSSVMIERMALLP